MALELTASIFDAYLSYNYEITPSRVGTGPYIYLYIYRNVSTLHNLHLPRVRVPLPFPNNTASRRATLAHPPLAPEYPSFSSYPSSPVAPAHPPVHLLPEYKHPASPRSSPAPIHSPSSEPCGTFAVGLRGTRAFLGTPPRSAAAFRAGCTAIHSIL